MNEVAPGATPGCHIAFLDAPWILGQDPLDEAELKSLSLLPDISIDPTSGLFSVINSSAEFYRAFFVTIDSIASEEMINMRSIEGEGEREREGYPSIVYAANDDGILQSGIYRETNTSNNSLGVKEKSSGRTSKSEYICITFILVVKPLTVMDVCWLVPITSSKPIKPSIFSDISNLTKDHINKIKAHHQNNKLKETLLSIKNTSQISEVSQGSEVSQQVSRKKKKTKRSKKKKKSKKKMNKRSQQQTRNLLYDEQDVNVESNLIAEEEQSSPLIPILGFPLGCGNDGVRSSEALTTPRSYLCSQGSCGLFTHFFPQTCYAVDFECPVGTPILAVGNGVVVAIRDSETVGGIHAKNLYKWNSIMLKIDLTTTTDTRDDDQRRGVKKRLSSNQSIVSNESEQDGLPSPDIAKAPHPFSILNNTSSKAKQKNYCFVEYVHISPGSCIVEIGDTVTEGEKICESGDVGFCPTPHLHLQVHYSDDDTAPTVQFKMKAKEEGEDGGDGGEEENKQEEEGEEAEEEENVERGVIKGCVFLRAGIKYTKRQT
eukprot:g3165.t1